MVLLHYKLIFAVMVLVFDNCSPTLHHLEIFIIKIKRYSRDLATIFPRDTDNWDSTYSENFDRIDSLIKNKLFQ